MLELNGICLRKNNILVIRDPAETGDPQCNLMSQKISPSFCQDPNYDVIFGTHRKAREMRLGLYFLGIGAGWNNNSIWLFVKQCSKAPYRTFQTFWPGRFSSWALKQNFKSVPDVCFPFPILRECSSLRSEIKGSLVCMLSMTSQKVEWVDWLDRKQESLGRMIGENFQKRLARRKTGTHVEMVLNLALVLLVTLSQPFEYHSVGAWKKMKFEYLKNRNIMPKPRNRTGAQFRRAEPGVVSSPLQ